MESDDLDVVSVNPSECASSQSLTSKLVGDNLCLALLSDMCDGGVGVAKGDTNDVAVWLGIIGSLSHFDVCW